MLAVALLWMAGCARPDAGAREAAALETGPPPPVELACGDRAVTAQLGEGNVTLTLAGDVLVLPQAESGVRFGRGDTLFWMTGETARLDLGSGPVECVATGDDAPEYPSR